MKILSAIILVLCMVSSSVAASLDTALNHFAKDEFSAAITELETYVSEKPEEAQGLFLLGYAYYKAGRMDNAMKQFKAAYLLDPDFIPMVPQPKPGH